MPTFDKLYDFRTLFNRTFGQKNLAQNFLSSALNFTFYISSMLSLNTLKITYSYL